MTAMLAFCVCGHTRDEHTGGSCVHVHAAKPKKDWPQAQCACVRFMLDERLTDSEDFIGKVLQKVRSKEGIDMEPVEWQEALQVLRIALWKTSCKYDSRSHIRFRVYAYFELFNDAIDHIRSERGRHGQHRVFDTRKLADEFDDGDGAAGAGRLDGAASRDPGDNPDNWAADAGGLLAEGDRPALEALRRDGGGDGRRDAAGDPEPVLRARRRSRAADARARGAAAGGGAESRVA